MICPNCGKEITDGSAFCTNCGALTNLDDGKKQDSEPTYGNSYVADEHVNPISADTYGKDTFKENSLNIERTITDDSATNKIVENGNATDAAYSEIPVVGKQNGKIGFDESMVKSMHIKVRPMRTWSFFWREIVSFLPIINLVVFFIQAFADGINFNARGFARAKLIKYLISTIILLVLIGMFLINYDWSIEFIRNSIDYLYNCIH